MSGLFEGYERGLSAEQQCATPVFDEMFAVETDESGKTG
jgi:hypothetical protein